MMPRYWDGAMRTLELMLTPWRRHMLAHSLPLGLPDLAARDRPLVLVANHTSWWDGFLLRDIHRALRPDSPLYTVMTETALRRFPFFRVMGAVPLHPGSAASTLRMVRTIRRLVTARPDATIAFFPQGRIWPAWRRPLDFRPGIELVLEAIAPCYVLPVGIHMEPLNHTAPSAFVLCGSPCGYSSEQPITAAGLEILVADRLDTIQSVLNRFGEDALAHMAGAA
jgi:hypothetical protein